MKSTDISNVSEPPALASLNGEELLRRWPTFSPAERRHLARQAGRLLHTLWAGRDDLNRLPLSRWSVRWVAGQPPAWIPPESIRLSLPIRLTPSEVCAVLADWLRAASSTVSRRDSLIFARAFFQHEVMDRQAYRHALNEIIRQARRAADEQARLLYGQHFQARRREGALAGWTRDPALSLAGLRDQILQAEQDPNTRWIKRRLPTRLFLATLDGRAVIIKRHDLRTRWEHLRYWVRASRARRSCAASLTVRDLGLPTPEPLAYLEVSRACSYIVHAWLPQVVSVRAWVRRNHQHWSADEWRAVRRELLNFYVTPYQAGFYHDDTKALNILLDPAAPPGRRMWWIDVEGVVAGGRLTRYRILRNLAQLNGSLRSWVPETERLAFLRGVAWYFPWLHEPRIAERLRAWTRRRLQREVERICGP